LKTILLYFLFVYLSTFSVYSQVATCDTPRDCIGRALTLSVSSGRGAHYVDIDKTARQIQLNSALTVEMWMNPVRQAGSKVYVAGLWGPGNDDNDQWVLYFDPNDNLVFEINGNGPKLRAVDNTILSIPGSSLYNKWSHVAAVFNGQNQYIYLYIDGVVVDSARNATYPTSQLRPLERPDLLTQIASTNAFSDNASNRTFRGQIDEYRMWNTARTPTQILCTRDLSLNGNEAGLILYYRFNEQPTNFTLCDATNGNSIGRARSGANCQNNNRTSLLRVTVLPSQIRDTVRCVDVQSWQFTILDTTICGSTVNFAITGPDASNFRVSQPNANLTPGVPLQVTVTFNGSAVGNLRANLRVSPTNRCGNTVTIPLNITRITELSYSRSSINFDTLYANCVEKPSEDSVFRICNNSAAVGNARPITINSFTNSRPGIFQIIPSIPLPIVLAPGQCVDVTVRFFSRDSSATYIDSIRVNSTDQCPPGFTQINLSGRVQEVLAIRTPSSLTGRVDSMNFGTTCVDWASDVQEYTWQNLTGEPISIESVSVPPNFIHKQFGYPLTLDPATGYRPNWIRMIPTVSGNIRDSVVFTTRVGGCTIRKKIIVKGRGFEPEVTWSTPNVDFGQVIVGQSATQNVVVTNTGVDTLRLSFFLRRGEAYFLTGSQGTVLLPGQTRSIPITFTPLVDSTYPDEICFYEQRCFVTQCIPVTGIGIKQIYQYEPIVMRTENVLGCSSELDTLDIRNISTSNQVLSNIVFDNPTNRFQLVSPAAIPNSISLQPNEIARFIFRYVPNDVTRDRADRAYIRYQTLGSPVVNWAASMIGLSQSPRFLVTDFKQYGTLEVGDSKVDTILIENTSAIPANVNNLLLPNGYTLVGTSRPIPTLLQPRDSIQAFVQFAPSGVQTFTGRVVVQSDAPCARTDSGMVEGKGVIIQLDAPISLINFGFTKPCECKTREIPLLNQSLVHPMTIDSIWIDNTRVTNGTPELFSWYSTYSPNGTYPYQIPPLGRDTLRIVYCPNTPSLPQFLNSAARLHIQASGSGWNSKYEVFLAGKRMLLMQPNPTTVGFPDTRVDTSANPLTVAVTIPGVAVNPDQPKIVIDSITFEPEERVFSVRERNNLPFPITLDSITGNEFIVDFNPRAPRLYLAKMIMHLSEPCVDRDTTILVRGRGFAPAFGLSMTFDSTLTNASLDTFKMTTCDTISIPLYSTREIPANLADISFRMRYDINVIRLLDIDSEYLQRSGCVADTFSGIVLQPSYTITDLDPVLGKSILLKNYCQFDSTTPLAVFRFVSNDGNRAVIRLDIDSVQFDTEGILYFQIIAGNSFGFIQVLKADLSIETPIQFDSVRILDCVTRQIVFRNTGDVPIQVRSLTQLQNGDVQMILDPLLLNTFIQPGDTISALVQFCPRSKQSFDTLAFAGGVSLSPLGKISDCAFGDSTTVRGIGYPTPLDLQYVPSISFAPITPSRGMITDTVSIPIMIDSDVSLFLRDTTFWLQKVRFNVDFSYNPRVLKFIGYESSIFPAPTVTEQLGMIRYEFQDVDSLRAGLLSEMKFVVLVPDSTVSELRSFPWGFDTDSLKFLEVTTLEGPSYFSVDGMCNLTTIKYVAAGPNALTVYPMPTKDEVTVEFSSGEKQAVSVSIYSTTGEKVVSLLSKETLSIGSYRLKYNLHDLPSGSYRIVLETKDGLLTEPLIIVK
jgi:hypothetical protein